MHRFLAILANSPLLITISSLEEKLLGLERENDILTRSTRQMSAELGAMKRRHEAEMETIERSLEEVGMLFCQSEFC